MHSLIPQQSFFRQSESHSPPTNLMHPQNSHPLSATTHSNTQNRLTTSSHNFNNLHLASLISPSLSSNSHQQRNLLLGALNSPIAPLSATNRESYNTPSSHIQNASNVSRVDTPSLIGPPSVNTPSSAGLPINLPPHINGKLLLSSKHGSPTGAEHPKNASQPENEKIHYLIVDLLNPLSRELALLELSKKREQWDDLALVLWHSFGVMSCLLQEIVAVYPLLSPPSLTANASNRVCNALALLQCVASHNETRALFLQAHLPLFLYPFLNTTSKTRPFEYLRLTSLGVIGALVKQNDNSEVINFLLSTEIIPLCLRIMETGSELSKTVAIFIVQKILLDEMGLAYICQTYERFYAVGTVLSNMVNQLVETQAVRLLKHVVRCYLRLSDNLRAREALRACLPEPLRDATFSQVLKGDLITKRCLASLLLNLSDRVE